ncbi:hypothetical protein, partial [Zavarzinia sp.]|uniref:hypothetical protein n=1 Tax=Zavarzinia sp. TaxID=2027920 RepID=UPI003BB62E77
MSELIDSHGAIDRDEAAPDLGGLLLDRGLLAPETLTRARLVQAETREPLDAVLTRLGMMSEESLAQALAGALS